MPTTPNTNEQMNPQRQRPNGGYTPIYRRRLFHENSNQSVSQQARERRELRSELFAQLQQLKSNNSPRLDQSQDKLVHIVYFNFSGLGSEPFFQLL